LGCDVSYLLTTQHYEKLLDLSKDADPGLLKVENARKRLEGAEGYKLCSPL
jgi:hypothetical protein